MVVIPAETIARVRESRDLVGFVEACGIKLRRKGSEFFGLCPFHEDHEPSLAVSATKQYWCCHGACSSNGKRVGGDVIEFARRLWGVSFPEALRRLGSTAATEAPAASSRPPLRLAGAPARPRREARPPRPGLLAQVVAFYHQTLLSSVPAKEYLIARGITDPTLIAALPIGYTDGSILERAPEGSETYEVLKALGVLTEGGRELLLGCVVVPMRDLAGNVVDLYGRAIDRKQHLYLTGPKRGLVNASCAATCEELIIAESVFDALSFLEAGIPNAVPMYGANGWTPDHDALLEKHRIWRVIFALDPDKAGRNAVAALTPQLEARGIEVRSVELPAKDPNELLVREGREGFAETWKRLLSPPLRPAAAPAAAEPEGAAAKEEKPTTAGLDTDAGAYVFTLGSRTYRVRGLSAFGVDRMRVNVRVEQGDRFHVDTFDLYSALSRRRFLDEAASVLGESDAAALAKEIAGVIDALERERLALRAKGKGETTQAPMSAAEREEALAFLRDPKLTERLTSDFAAVGCVGEESAMLVGYLAALSRKLDEPLSVIFCARSGAGKSNLQDRICELLPPEDVIRYTRITGQALFYQDENALVHKALAIDEEEGAAQAAYSLRNLQSGGFLTVSATRTDPQTGKHKADTYRVNGPTAIFLTTAHPEALDYETRNRFLILTVDESKEQTRKILERQRWAETLDGLIAKDQRAAVLRRHHNAQRLLEPLPVVNPLALSLAYPADRLILRREQKKYLALIKAIALFHQHQRKRKTAQVDSGSVEYIEVAESDIALASSLAAGLLRRNLDELAPPTRSLLGDIRRLMAGKTGPDAFFDRRQIQKATGLSLWHIKLYLAQLIEYEYVAPVYGRKGKRYLYELLWDGEEEDPAEKLGGTWRNLERQVGDAVPPSLPKR